MRERESRSVLFGMGRSLSEAEQFGEAAAKNELENSY